MGNHPSAPHEPLQGRMGPAAFQRGTSLRRSHGRGMERLRRSFRDSFRRRKGEGGGGGAGGAPPESARPHQWQADEAAVRAATCAFPVKYLGCVEVFESRGMQVCEEALKVLRASRRRAVRAALHVSGDGLRVVEDDTKGLIVDQTIEKVSFCAPDRNHERGFSYICRDGTTRRWMCHGFLAVRDPGERLSHAVGCAFSACLERKQRRDKDTLVTAELVKSQHNRILYNGGMKAGGDNPSCTSPPSSAPPVPRPAPPPNPFAIERPHAAPHMLERQGSFRGFSHLNNNSPFKRQMSLRINDLPSNLERLRSVPAAPALPPLPQAMVVPAAPPSSAPLPSLTPLPAQPSLLQSEAERDQQVAALCQQVSRGLQLLSLGGDPEPEPVPLEVVAERDLPAPDQWLGRLTSPPAPAPLPPPAPVSGPTRRAPGLSQRARSLGGDPFDAEWAAPARATNPFLQRAI